MPRRVFRILLILLVVPPIVSAVMGWLVAPSFLHPVRRPLTPDLVREADASFAHSRAHREDFPVSAPDGAVLRGWKVRPETPNGAWVLLFHGVADNRVGTIGQSEILLSAGYGVVMMDQRAHGESGGEMATYGWLERNDTRAVIDALAAPEHPAHIFALGGRWERASRCNRPALIRASKRWWPKHRLREASYDYAGLQEYPLLGKTLFAPGARLMLYRGGKIAGFSASGVSPERAVAARSFPVLLICDEKDTTLPCRHAKIIYAAARGPKSLWMVPGALHTAALGFAPEEFRRRVLDFFHRPGPDDVQEAR